MPSKKERETPSSSDLLIEETLKSLEKAKHVEETESRKAGRPVPKDMHACPSCKALIPKSMEMCASCVMGKDPNW